MTALPGLPIGAGTGGRLRSVTVLGYMTYFMLGWSSVLIPAFVESIKSTFDRSDSGIAAAYLIGASVYAVGAIGGGMISDRLGSRAVLCGAIAVLGAGLIAQAWAPVWLFFLAAIGIAKTGGGAIEGGVQAVFLQIHTGATGGALNLLHLFFGLGSLAGPIVVALAIHIGVSWNELFFGVGLLFFALAAAVALAPGYPAALRRVKIETANEPTPAPENSMRPFIWLAIAMGLYEAAGMGIASWMVRFFEGSSVGLATGALSLFWAGVSLSRIAARWTTRLLPPRAFTIASVLLMSVILLAAVLVPWPIASVALFGLTGFVLGPIFPMIVAIGGELYPHRLARVSGGLSAAATIGAIVYPPLMGVLASSAGIKIGFIGAAALGVPTVFALYAARSPAQR